MLGQHTSGTLTDCAGAGVDVKIPPPTSPGGKKSRGVVGSPWAWAWARPCALGSRQGPEGPGGCARAACPRGCTGPAVVLDDCGPGVSAHNAPAAVAHSARRGVRASARATCGDTAAHPSCRPDGGRAVHRRREPAGDVPADGDSSPAPATAAAIGRFGRGAAGHGKRGLRGQRTCVGGGWRCARKLCGKPASRAPSPCTRRQPGFYEAWQGSVRHGDMDGAMASFLFEHRSAVLSPSSNRWHHLQSVKSLWKISD